MIQQVKRWGLISLFVLAVGVAISAYLMALRVGRLESENVALASSVDRSTEQLRKLWVNAESDSRLLVAAERVNRSWRTKYSSLKSEYEEALKNEECGYVELPSVVAERMRDPPTR